MPINSSVQTNVAYSQKEIPFSHLKKSIHATTYMNSQSQRQGEIKKTNNLHFKILFRRNIVGIAKLQ